MKKTIKLKQTKFRTLIGVLTTFACVLCFSATLFLPKHNVKAEVTAKTIEEVTISMQKGASVRMDTDESKIGIRYQTYMSVSDYLGLQKSETDGTYSGVVYGILVAPRVYHENAALNDEANLVGDTAVYNWSSSDGSYTEEEGKRRIINLHVNELAEETVNDQTVYAFTGSVVNFKDVNIPLDYVGVGYIRYVDQEGNEHFKFAADNENTRSMYDVAQKAVADRSENAVTTEQKKMLDRMYTEKVNASFTQEDALDYRVLLSGDYTSAEKYAADELVELYKEITGKTLPIVYGYSTNTTGYYIAIGNTQMYSANSHSAMAAQGEDGFVIKAVDNSFVLNSAGETGKVYSVYEFLAENFNLEFFAGDVYTYDSATTLNTSLDVAQAPTFADRNMANANFSNYSVESMRMRFDGNVSAATTDTKWSSLSAHTYFKLCPTENYETHPKWFYAPDGKPLQLCIYTMLNDSEMYNVILTNLKAVIESEADKEYFMFGAEDYGDAYCQCGNCATVDTPISKRNVQAANKLASDVKAWLQETAPERVDKVKIGVFAYNNSTLFPASDSTVEDNVFIYFAPIGIDHALNLTADEASSSTYNARVYNSLQGWVDLAPGRVFIWDYSSAFCDYLAPFDDLKTLQQHYQVYANLGVTYVSNQGPRETQVSVFGAYRNYLNSKLMWNVNANVSELQEAFFNAYYGDAATAMKGYYNTIQSKLDALHAAGKNTGTTQSSIFNSDCWSKDELSSYLETLNGALTSVEGTEYYDRVLSETIFVRSALLSFYAEEAYSTTGDLYNAVSSLETDAVALGADYVYEGWYTYQSSMQYMIDQFKVNNAELRAMCDTAALNDDATDYASRVNAYMWSGISNCKESSGIEVSYETAPATFDSDVLAAAVAKGYESVTVSVNKNGNISDYDFWLPITGGNGKEVASAKKVNPFTATILLSDLKNTDGTYTLSFNEVGWSQSNQIFHISSMKFNKPVADLAKDALDTEGTNFAANEWLGLYTGSAGDLTYTADKGVTVPYAEGNTATFNADVLASAVEKGYESVTVTLSNTGFDFWLKIKGGNDTTILSDKKVGSLYTTTIDLSALKNNDGTYSMSFSTDGWSQWNEAFYIESLTFNKPVDVLAEAMKALDTEGTNFAAEKLLGLYTGSAGDLTYTADKGITVSYETTGATFNADVLAAAVEKGYTKVTVTLSNTGFAFWLTIKGGNDTTIVGGAAVEYPFTTTIDLSKLKNNDGTYSMSFSTAGWWQSNQAFYIESLTFTKPPVEPEEPVEDPLVTEAKTALDAIGTDFAAEKWLGLYSGSAGDLTYTADKGITVSYVATGATFNADVLAAAVEKGYTKVTVTLSNTGFDFWLKIKGGNDTTILSDTNVGSPYTTTIDLSALKNNDGTYSMSFSTAGWWGGCAFYIESITFGSLKTDAIAALDTEGTDFAAEGWLGLYTGSAGDLTYTADKGITVSYVAQTATFNADVLAAAVEKGYTKVTVTLSNTGFDFWLKIKGGNDTTILSDTNVGSPYTTTIDLSALKNTDGTYNISFTTEGWWSTSHVFYIESVTFSK